MSEGTVDDGVVASGVEVVEIAEAERMLASGEEEVFTERELRYARGRVDPGRRLAARLAAKRVACRLLGGAASQKEVEVSREAYGPPALHLSGEAGEQLRALGARQALVSLTHERSHAAALVVLVRDSR